MSDKNYTNPATIALHTGWRKDETTNSVTVPIHMTSSYQFDDADHAANLFALGELGNIYTRIMNPTNAVFEERIAALEGGVAALSVASGQSASTIAVQNLARTGDNIVASSHLYGGTYNLFKNVCTKGCHCGNTYCKHNLLLIYCNSYLFFFSVITFL